MCNRTEIQPGSSACLYERTGVFSAKRYEFKSLCIIADPLCIIADPTSGSTHGDLNVFGWRTVLDTEGMGWDEFCNKYRPCFLCFTVSRGRTAESSSVYIGGCFVWDKFSKFIHEIEELILPHDLAKQTNNTAAARAMYADDPS